MATSAGSIAAAAVAKARREVREEFEQCDATAPGRAIPYDPPKKLHRQQFNALVGRGVIRPTGAGTYWFDREAAQADEERQRAAAFVVLKVTLILFAIGIAAAAIFARGR